MDGLDYILIFALTNVCAFSIYFTRKLFKINCTSFRCCGMEFIQDVETGDRHGTTSTDNQPSGIIRV